MASLLFGGGNAALVELSQAPTGTPSEGRTGLMQDAFSGHPEEQTPCVPVSMKVARNLIAHNAMTVRAGISGRFQLCRKRFQMLVRTTELQLDGHQPFEVMTDDQLVGHAHPAMQLHRLLSDKPAGLADHDLGC